MTEGEGESVITQRNTKPGSCEKEARLDSDMENDGDRWVTPLKGVTDPVTVKWVDRHFCLFFLWSICAKIWLVCGIVKECFQTSSCYLSSRLDLKISCCQACIHYKTATLTFRHFQKSLSPLVHTFQNYLTSTKISSNSSVQEWETVQSSQNQNLLETVPSIFKKLISKTLFLQLSATLSTKNLKTYTSL